MPEKAVQSVYELLAKEYGVERLSEEAPQVTSVGTSSVILFPNNPRRLGLVVVNLSANQMYLRAKAPASATAGIQLAPGGGSASMNCREDFHLPSLEWQIVASAAESALYAVGIQLG